MRKFYDMDCLIRLENTKCNIDDNEAYTHYIHNDIDYLKDLYKKRTGLNLCLTAPALFSEKLQWLKLFGRNSLYYKYVDKSNLPNIAEEYSIQSISPKHIVTFNCAEDIDFNNLPNRFVLKATHASGYNLIVTDKTLVDQERVRNAFKRLLKIRYYALKYEWPYEGVTPRIICEPYIPISDSIPLDYKFHCFNGKVIFCEILNAITKGDYSEEPIELIVDRNYTRLDFSYGFANKAIFSDSPDYGNMVRYAEILSKPFPYVRIDFINPSKGIIQLGEFTFFPGAGFDLFYPMKYNYIIGDLIKLPNV